VSVSATSLGWLGLLLAICAWLLPAAPAAAAPVVAAAGQIACDTTSQFYNGGAGEPGHCRQRATSDLLVGGGFSSVLTLGDAQFHVGATSDFEAVFDPTWGRVKPIIRPAPGVHDYSTSNARGYFDYFNGAGKHSGPAGERDKGYYSFDIGSWHLIALNTQCDHVAHGGALNGCAPGSPQNRWLQSDLAAHRSSCTLAYWHAPRFNSGLRGNSPAGQPFWDVLHAAGVDVVLNADAHHYERFAPQDPNGALDPARGIRQFVVGTGGVFFTGWSKLKPNSEVRQNNTFGVLALTLHPTSYEWRFLPEAGGSFTDAGSGACHGRTVGFTPRKPPPPVRSVKSSCTIRGTNSNDRLNGTAKKDVICGLGGRDRIRGLGGNDVLRGGPGRDRLLGGRGRDRLYGDTGNDVLRGQRGRDRIVGGIGKDRIYGDRGNDLLSARDSRGHDRVFGGRGRDRAKTDRGDRTRSVERVARR
jgi:Ca2+-binding RTX toxin-like protein